MAAGRSDMRYSLNGSMGMASLTAAWVGPAMLRARECRARAGARVAAGGPGTAGGVPRGRRARSLGRDALGLELPYLVDDVAGDVALAARRQLFEQLVQEARQRGGLVAHAVQVRFEVLSQGPGGLVAMITVALEG